MTPEVFETTLRSLVRQTPFQPFYIEMEEDERVLIEDPERLAFGGGGAGYFQEEDLVLIDCEQVLEIRPRAAKAG